MSELVTQDMLPTEWEKQETKNIKLVEVTKNSSEYYVVQNYLSGSALENKTQILRVQNPYLYGRYQLRKVEYVKKFNNTFEEKTLLHATSARNVNPIIDNNFDWRLVKRSKFGKGVSFSPDAMYANKECRANKTSGNDRAVIICKVLMRLGYVGSYSCKLPKENFDSTTDIRGKVIVKYYDDEFYPEYVVYYKNEVYQANTLRSRTFYCDADYE